MTRLLGMSLAFAEEVMGMQLSPDHKHFARVLSIKQSIAASMLTVTARVNSGSLRPSSDDGLADMLRRVNLAEGVLTAEDVLN